MGLIDVSEQEQELIIKGLQALKGQNILIVKLAALKERETGIPANDRDLARINDDQINTTCLLDRLMFGQVDSTDLARKELATCPV